MTRYSTWKDLKASMPAKSEEETERHERLMKHMRAETRGYRLLEKRVQAFGHTRAQIAELIGMPQ